MAAAGLVAAHIVHRARRERVQQRRAAVTAQQGTRRGPRLALIGADAPARAAAAGAHDAEEAAVGEFDKRGLLAGTDFGVAGIGHAERLLVEGEPRDADVLGLGVFIDVLEAHELDARVG